MEGIIATREDVQDFLSIQFGSGSGYGNGRGYGYGNGCGYGYGNGCGSGYGSGSGSGSGSGYANGCGSYYGNGYGYGSGDGSGDGDGYGSGYGNGCGSGYGDIKALNGNIVDYVDFIPTIITQVRNNIACGYIVKNDLTLSPCYVAKVGNSFAHGNTLKEAVADAEAKELEEMPVEERIAKFVETFGSLDSEYIGKEFYNWHHILTDSCRMGRDEFCKSHNIDLEKIYTVRYFLQITEKAYGGEIIRKVIESYKRKEEEL